MKKYNRNIAIVLFLFFVAGSAIITVYQADSYRSRIHDDVVRSAENLAGEIRAARYVQTDSKAYEDDVNAAQALALLRYYRYQLGEKYGFDKPTAALYEKGKVKGKRKEKYVDGLSLFEPPVTVIVGSPLYRNSKIMVPADFMDSEQLAGFEKKLKSGKDIPSYFEMSGYQDGRFFYPYELDGEKYSVRPRGKKVRDASFQDFQIITSKGKVLGTYGRETNPVKDKEEPSEYRVFDIPDEFLMNNRGTETGENEDLFRCNTYAMENVDERFLLYLGIDAPVLVTVMKNMIPVYITLFAVILAIGAILIFSVGRSLEENFESEKRRRLMIDAVAHELKTPLSIIRNYGEIMIEEDDDGKKKEYAGVIVDESEEMNRDIVSLIELSKMEAGTYPLELSEFSLEKVAVSVIGQYQALAENKNITIKLKTYGDSMIYADRKLVGYIISNYLSNAVRHAKEGSEIDISIDNTDMKDMIEIKVANKGRNISEEEGAKIWESYTGSGMGLAIVKNACALHEGTCGFSNEDDGVVFTAALRKKNAEGRAKARTGRVLNIRSGSADISGLDTAAYGFLISAFGYVIGSMAFFEYGFISPIVLSVLMVGCVVLLAGVLNLRKKGFGTNFLFACSVLLAVSVGWMLLQRYTGNYIWASVLPLLMMVLLILISCSVSTLAADVPEQAGDTRRATNYRRRRNFAAVMMAVPLITLICDLQNVIPWGVFGGIWVGISTFVSLNWIGIYRLYREQK